MNNTILVGAQWGDEGKGKIVDLLSSNYDVIVRFNGGANAGHTIYHDGKKYVLHILPSGIFHQNKTCIIASGMVIDLQTLVNEIKLVENLGLLKTNTLIISPNAHIVMPWHKDADEKNVKNIGSTGRGIGPTYESKVARDGIRISDLMDYKKILDIFGRHKEWTSNVTQFYSYANIIRPYVRDVWSYLDTLPPNYNVLYEGAQGTLLDIDYGTYPYVTSSNCIASNACVSAGVSLHSIKNILGVSKAYTTRVGHGPFPTEMEDNILRELGEEYGATTGRPRRCGWLDLVLLKYAVKINGIDKLILTKLDVLGQLPKIKVCNAYLYKNKIYNNINYELLNNLDDVEPLYLEFDTWGNNYASKNMYTYIRYIEYFTDIKIEAISIGKNREDYLDIHDWLMPAWKFDMYDNMYNPK